MQAKSLIAEEGDKMIYRDNLYKAAHKVDWRKVGKYSDVPLRDTVRT